ncbi:hypothetical protein [Bradyrhizobium barranii]
MKRVMLTTIILVFGTDGARAEVPAAQCSSYYISEINLVSTADTEAGHVQTFVAFGLLERGGGEERLRVLLAHQL